MELFDIAFNKQSIYETLFFNVKSVTAYKDVFTFQEKEPELFEQWKFIAATKYNVSDAISVPEEAYMQMLNDIYKLKAVYYPEFSKIVAITYATVTNENGQLTRHMKKIAHDDELKVISIFRDVLIQISSDGIQSKPQYFPTLCGHNIINNDIPLFIKRIIYHREKLDKENNIPYILKNHLKAKPWDANVIDTINMWKFNGVSNTPLLMIADFVGLKRKVDLLQMDELSKYYWNNIEDNPAETLSYMALQSANQTNLVIQLLNEFRYL